MENDKFVCVICEAEFSMPYYGEATGSHKEDCPGAGDVTTLINVSVKKRVRKLSPAQTLVIDTLLQRGYGRDSIISSYTEFPERDNIDNGRRRAINTMCRNGSMKRVVQPAGNAQITDKTLRMYYKARQ